MKKTLIALAVLASVAGVAQAQSAVTIYGKLDQGVTKLRGDTEELGLNSTTQMQANHSSRIGFKGTEDLGGGLSAIFQFENRFNPDTGAVPEGAALFSGPAFVGLAGNFGSVKLGRNWSTIDGISTAAIDPFEGDGIGGLNTVIPPRINNTITYQTPEMSGFGAQVQYILGERSANTLNPATPGVPFTDAERNNGYAVGVNYNNGPIYVGAGYGRIENSDDSDVWGVSGSYAFGPAKIALGYDHLENNLTGGEDTKNAVVAATYEIGAGLIKAGYNHTKDGVDNTITGAPGTFEKIQKLSIGYQHNLSKRTSLYADVARTRYTDVGFKNSVNGVGVGVTHNF